MRRSMSHWYFGQEEVGGGSRPAISMIGHRAGGATRITLPVRDRHARDDRPRLPVIAVAMRSSAKGRRSHRMNSRALLLCYAEGSSGAELLWEKMSQVLSSATIWISRVQKKMAPEIRSQVLGGTMHRAEGRDNLGNFLISLELRRRRAECRRCGYLPPRRPSASGRGWQGNGRTGCWRSEGRSWRSWTSGFSGCREAVGVPSFRE